MIKWFNQLKLATRIVLVTLVIVLGVMAVNYLVFLQGYRASAQAALVEKAKAFSAVADEAKNHASLLHRMDTFQSQALAAELAKDLAAGKHVEQTRFFQTIPVVAGWTAAQEAARREQIEFGIAAFEARNKAHEPKSGTFEEKLLRDLTTQAAAGQGDTIYAVDPATQQLHFMRAIRLTDNCLVCHGDPGSQWDVNKTGKDLTGNRMEGWKTGQMHGSYHVVLPLAPLRAQVRSFLFNGLAWSVPLMILGLAGFIYLVWLTVGHPVRILTGRTMEIARGDLVQDVPEELRGRGDELGELARSMQTMSESLRKLLREVTQGVRTLASASTELSSISSETALGVKAMSEKSATVAAAAEESSANSVSVAASMEEATTNLASVASATEEMSATVSEIAANSERARTISEQANAQAQTLSALMQQLGDAARSIGKVTETITDISSQTNLLALNATIEAARAGAAGKGFAVVANEIKELARQTAQATEDIKAKIAGVQNSTGGAIADIEKISGISQEVGTIVSTIAAAIEEQATVTKDVAANIAQATTGVKDANERVAQTATVSKDIARDIAHVNESVSEIRRGGSLVESSAGQLSTLADQLTAIVSQFKLNAAAPRETKTGTAAGHVRLPWKEEYSVGVVSMDAHHQKLVSLINRLDAAVKAGENEAAIRGIFKELVNYTQYHFKAEEDLMARIDYPTLPEHQKIHRDFLDAVSATHARWKSGDTAVPQELLRTLEQWLIQHITGVDKQYGAHYARHADDVPVLATPTLSLPKPAAPKKSAALSPANQRR
jgi:methyl-accepting chemotaxis protein